MSMYRVNKHFGNHKQNFCWQQQKSFVMPEMVKTRKLEP